jgi:hypothetical protein
MFALLRTVRHDPLVCVPRLSHPTNQPPAAQMSSVVLSARELLSIKQRAHTGKLVMDATGSSTAPLMTPADVEAARKAGRKQASSEKSAKWKDTLAALRDGKVKAKAQREEAAEAARCVIDAEVCVCQRVSVRACVRACVRSRALVLAWL